MGSVHGTYIQMETLQSKKVRLDQQVVLKGQNYLIGSDIFLNVIELQSNMNQIGSSGEFENS